MSLHRVTCSGLLYGQTHQNVLHFNNPDGVWTHSQIANDIETNWVNRIKLHQVTSMVWTQIIVQEVSLSPIASFTKAINQAGTNLANADAVPFSCFVIQIKTAAGGPHGRGRFYVGGLTNNSHTNGIVTAAVLTAWVNSLNILKGFYGPSGTSQIRLVVKEKSNNTFNLMTDLICRQYVGVQRRRNYGVGI